MLKQIVFIFGLTVTIQLVLAGNALAVATEKFCIIPIGSKSNYILQWPLVFDKSGKLYPTSNDIDSGTVLIKVKAGEQVTLSCGPNYFKHKYHVEVLTASCNGANGKFVVDEIEKQANELTCDLRVIEDVLDDVQGCVDTKLTAARFGYVDPNEKQTMLLGEVCYDQEKGKTHFAHVKLGDYAASHLDVLPKNYLTSKRHTDGRYKLELFRGLLFDEIYERIRSTLHIKHAPMLKLKNFVDETLLSSAQFQAVKKLGWNYFVGYDEHETLESLKRDIKSLSKNMNLELYVGSYGVKQFNGDNGLKMEMYLRENPQRFPMPSFLWFVVKQADKATAFAVSNDADDINRLSQPVNNEAANICKTNDCSKVTWLSTELKQDEKLICCDVNEIRKSIQEIPTLANIKGMLL